VADDPWAKWQAFAEQTAGGNRATAPIAEWTERFADAARAFLEQTAGAQRGATQEAAAAFGNFLRDQSIACFRFPWSDASAGAATGAPWAALADLPALGVTREHQQRWQLMAEAALRMADAQRQLQRMWADALRDAAGEFSTRLATEAGRDGAVRGAASPGARAASRGARAALPGADVLRGLYDSWIDCAERAYAAVVRTDAFASALADFVNAGSCWRRELIASIEHWSKLLDLPTRSEVNSLNTRLMRMEERLGAEQRRPARTASGGRRPASRPSRASRARGKRKPQS